MIPIESEQYAITVFNHIWFSLVIAAIGLTVHFEFRNFLHVAVAAINEIFNEPTDVFWTGRAMNLLFDGIEIDCSTTNPLAKLACTQMRKNKNQAIQQIDKNRMIFSVLGGVKT